MGGGLCGTRRKPPPGGGPAAGRSGACGAPLRKQNTLSHGARPAHPCAERSCKGPPGPPGRFPAGADGKGAIKREAETGKAAIGCLSCFQSIHAWRGSTTLGLPLPGFQPREGWKGRVDRAARDRWRHRAPMDGFTACPGQPCRPGPRHEAQRGNALNLTAPRKYPPRPCRCRCTWSPCRISAGDDAGRAAASRCGSRRSHPADGPGRSRRPAG